MKQGHMNPEKKAARQAVSNAIRAGRIDRKPCEVCGTSEDVQSHHDDYSKPLDVRWLCSKHHWELHKQSGILRSKRVDAQMKVFNFHIPAPLRERLLAERDRTGLSEAEIVRRALDDHLEQREDRSGERAIEGRNARATAV